MFAYAHTHVHAQYYMYVHVHDCMRMQALCELQANDVHTITTVSDSP